MRKYLVHMLVLLAGALIALPAWAADPLVSIDWVKSKLGSPGLVILDVTSGGGRSKADFEAAHIPGSIYTDYAKAGWREKNAEGVVGMLPAVDKLEKLIGSHGIDNATHVILVPMGRNAQDTGAATRLYWTFKVLGHDAVSLLDGGFVGWIADVDKATNKPVNPLEAGASNPSPKTYKASLHGELIASKDEVKVAIAEKQTLVDNRPNDFFIGVSKSKDAKVGGTIPGATNLPESWLTENNGGRFRTRTQLEKLYQAAGVPTSGKQINFCNTGHWASLGWFVSSEIMGNKSAKMYDGSMADWTRDQSTPVQRSIVVE
ncbi:MAG: sulfurtransferase [Hyphomicrobiaceae bacterium]